MKIFFIALTILVVIAGGIFLVLKKSSKPTSTQSSLSASSTDTSATQIITYGNNGFSPSVLTVKAGSAVTIKNTTSGPVQFNSDPHPMHTDDPDLNVGTVASSQSQMFTVTKKGTFGYHNHLNPNEKGTITIQ